MFKEIYKKYVLRYYKLLIVLGVIIGICISGFFIIYHYSYNTRQEIIKKPNNTIESKTNTIKEEKEIYYYIDIKGSVVNPNVYQVSEGTRIIDIIKLAGGLTEQADTSILNLSKKVNDEMVIIIYTRDEINSFRESGKTNQEVIKYIEKDCSCPDPNINGACINNESTKGNDDLSSKISLNSATKEDLMTLSGIGEAKAQNIIDYRLTNGPFESIEDIKNITGIGDSIFDKIKDYITL